MAGTWTGVKRLAVGSTRSCPDRNTSPGAPSRPCEADKRMYTMVRTRCTLSAGNEPSRDTAQRSGDDAVVLRRLGRARPSQPPRRHGHAAGVGPGEGSSTARAPMTGSGTPAGNDRSTRCFRTPSTGSSHCRRRCVPTGWPNGSPASRTTSASCGAKVRPAAGTSTTSSPTAGAGARDFLRRSPRNWSRCGATTSDCAAAPAAGDRREAEGMRLPAVRASACRRGPALAALPAICRACAHLIGLPMNRTRRKRLPASVPRFNRSRSCVDRP